MSLKDRYQASVVLSGVGDALGYNNGNWEFCNSGTQILKELAAMGGLEAVDIDKWIVSDDTVMHLATGEALIKAGKKPELPELYKIMAEVYQDCMHDMDERSPGWTCMEMVSTLNPDVPGGLNLKFNPKGGGCGAAMHAMCIGLRFPQPSEEKLLIEVSIESGRLTHHHPTGYLGALTAVLFTAYAVNGKPPREWGRGLLEVLPKAKSYIVESGRDVQENLETWGYFEKKWNIYLEERGILDSKSEPKFPDAYGPAERDAFYSTLSYQGWAGASGHDAPMIAYDALLKAGSSWVTLAHHGFFHGGDSDTTGVIAACWWGAIYCFEGVPKCNYEKLEYKSRLAKIGEELYELSRNQLTNGGGGGGSCQQA
ncbi:ADP-ribosylhydrolase ARH1-like isoform X1 [Erpetoichthys calabaricus]|uniref:ADP-ribosylhydrolase ARH1-like isoform X1 n=2 Tax=Erpetoichthys calabaricus TaxID=27687 RepID=UPI002234D770|nr:ADP-ribosylhydrolase ARH1-like isoform X1 [Erpetoichthys calabaricus]